MAMSGRLKPIPTEEPADHRSVILIQEILIQEPRIVGMT
jgi:hypothetical protein